MFQQEIKESLQCEKRGLIPGGKLKWHSKNINCNVTAGVRDSEGSNAHCQDMSVKVCPSVPGQKAGLCAALPGASEVAARRCSHLRMLNMGKCSWLHL